MNVSGTSPSIGWTASRSTGTRAANGTGAQAPADSKGDFLKYARMSPMERMRANILKGMNLTEEQLGALPQDERQKIEDKIKDGIRKMVSDEGRTGRLVDVSA